MIRGSLLRKTFLKESVKSSVQYKGRDGFAVLASWNHINAWRVDSDLSDR